ncbi:MAG: hypothetical protein ACFFAS_14200 [Promethearchaeota archaeon]
MENKEQYSLQGIWKKTGGSSKKRPENSIIVRGKEIKHIIDKIMDLTSDEGIIEIYRLKDNTYRTKPFKILKVCNKMDLCYS